MQFFLNDQALTLSGTSLDSLGIVDGTTLEVFDGKNAKVAHGRSLPTSTAVDAPSDLQSTNVSPDDPISSHVPRRRGRRHRNHRSECKKCNRSDEDESEANGKQIDIRSMLSKLIAC